MMGHILVDLVNLLNNVDDFGVSMAFPTVAQRNPSNPSCFAHVNGLRRGFSTSNIADAGNPTWTYLDSQNLDILTMCKFC